MNLAERKSGDHAGGGGRRYRVGSVAGEVLLTGKGSPGPGVVVQVKALLLMFLLKNVRYRHSIMSIGYREHRNYT